MKHLLALILLMTCASAGAQTLKLYKFNTNTNGKKQPFITTRTVKSYPIGYTYREGAENPRLTFTPYNDKWYILQDIQNGDTITSYIKRKNVYISEYQTGELPLSMVGHTFFGDGATIRIMKMNKNGHTVANVDGIDYVMDINVGYYAYTFPLVPAGNSFNLEEVGETIITATDEYGRLIDRYGKFRCDAKCVDNQEKPLLYYLPEISSIYYNGKILHLQK